MTLTLIIKDTQILFTFGTLTDLNIEHMAYKDNELTCMSFNWEQMDHNFTRVHKFIMHCL